MTDTTVSVLMIDDSESDAGIVDRYLEEIPDTTFQFHHEETGREGVEELQRATYDLVLLDFVLAESTGMEVVSKIRSSGYEGPVLMITGKSWRLASEAIGHGADGYIEKKRLSADKLEREISHVLKKHEETKEEKTVKTSEWNPTDKTSELFNRAFFIELLREKVRDAILKPYPISLLLFDIQDFENLERLYGTENRDKAVKRLAAIMDEKMEIPDAAGRYSNSLFSLVLLRKDRVEALEIANHIQNKMHDQVFQTQHGKKFHLLMDSGVSHFRTEDLQDLSEDEGVVMLNFQASQALLWSSLKEEPQTVLFNEIEREMEEAEAEK